MKKPLILTVLLITIAVCAFTQAFDDLPYTNADSMTYFQQEMKSLFRFMSENELNIPFYISFSMKYASGRYDALDTFDFFNNHERFREGADSYFIDPEYRNVIELNALAGANIKINNMFSIPLFINFGWAQSGDLAEFELTYNGYTMDIREKLDEQTLEFYFGTGLFMNTDIVKGAVLLGMHQKEYSIGLGNSLYDNYHDLGGVSKPLSFRAEIVPSVETSSLKGIGKALKTVLGYLGVGAVISYEEEDTGLFKTAADTLNAGLDFTFNRINWGALNLDLEALYHRGSYDAASKASTYGLRMQGIYNSFVGFGIEGGYKHFYYIFEPFLPCYDNTGYVKASLFFPLKKMTLGATFYYDNIYKASLGIAFSTNFLSGFFDLNRSMPGDRITGDSITGNFGARYRHGGWKAN